MSTDDKKQLSNEVKRQILQHAEDSCFILINNVRAFPDSHVDLMHEISKDLKNGDVPDMGKVWDLYSLVKGVEWAARHVLLISLCVSLIPSTLVAVNNYMESRKPDGQKNYISLSDLLEKYMKKPVDDWVLSARSKGVAAKMCKDVKDQMQTWTLTDDDGLDRHFGGASGESQTWSDSKRNRP